jgi:subtilisin family serine protease
MKTKLIAAFFLFSLVTYSQTTYFIKYKDHVPLQQVEEKIQQQSVFSSFQFRPLINNEFIVQPAAGGLNSINDRLARIIKVSFASDIDEGSFLQLLEDQDNIEYVQQQVKYQIHGIPNDSLVHEQWALSTIKAFDAWEITMGNDSVLVAVIDTGIDYEHPELKNKIYLNQGEIGTDLFGNDKRSNNKDDDGNGFIDDFMGWDFTDRVGFPFDSTGGDYLGWDNDPMDEHGHGTYIAGILAAETNNVTGIAGAAPNIRILNLRAFDPSGYGEEDDVAAAILYAITMGAKVINMSFGDNSFSYVLRDVIRYAYAQNIVLISSSGNSGSNLPHYPSGYSEVISVGNSTDKDFVAPSSNWGSTIDLVAPGSSILTTAPNNNYALISGTSASSPHVAAAAALILSIHNFTNEEVKQIIKSTCDDIGEPGWDLRSGAGRLNLYRAVSVLAPSRILFHHPRQDYTTLKDTLNINVSILSAYFNNFSLYPWCRVKSNELGKFNHQWN